MIISQKETDTQNLIFLDICYLEDYKLFENNL